MAPFTSDSQQDGHASHSNGGSSGNGGGSGGGSNGGAAAAPSAGSQAWSQCFAHHHSPLSDLRRYALLTPLASVVSLINPHRGDLVAAVGDASSSRFTLRNLVARMRQSQEGRYILRHKPRIQVLPDELRVPENTSTTTYAHAGTLCSELEKDTFGFKYYQWLKDHGYSPTERAVAKYTPSLKQSELWGSENELPEGADEIEDEDIAYVLQRYREVHDLWHILTACPTSVRGELAQKCFEFQQTGLPVALLASIVGPLRLPWEDKYGFVTQDVPWVRDNARSSRFLLGQYLEGRFGQNLRDVRTELGITPYHGRE